MGSFDPDAHWFPPDREVFAPDAWESDPPEPVGVILDKRGQPMRVVMPERQPFGFQPTRRARTRPRRH